MATIPRVGVLGGGQLGRMLLEAANRLNVQVNVLDAAGAPAKQISNHAGHVDGAFTDKASIEELATRSDVLTVEIEHVDTLVLEQVAARVAVEPSWQTIRTIQDKYAQKLLLEKNQVALAPFVEIPANSEAELQRVGAKFGFPFMLKSKRQAYDGKGNYPVKEPKDFAGALKALGSRELYAEKWAPFTKELAVMVVKTKDGVLSFETVETVHEDSVCKLVYAPARSVDGKTRDAAQALARKAVACFAGKGVFGVEMFLLADGQLLINEIAPRPHNSGHYTIEACGLSQYDAHLRAILDLPIPPESLEMKVPAAIMLNILGGATRDTHLQLRQAALGVPNASIHLYGKGDARPGRKVGHITLTANRMAQAESTIAPLVAFTDKLRAERTDIPAPDPRPAGAALLQSQPGDARVPRIAVLMGSDSDLPTLKAGLEILKLLDLPHTVRITSAHRTPDVMADFAKAAAGQGIQVIIAAAGGAAHLPGMVAAHTTLPVIGVPVRGSVLDGVDSLYSEVQMPRGVPLATVGIGNSTNAALLAARILGAADHKVNALVAEYAARAETEVKGKDARLKEVGWEGYGK